LSCASVFTSINYTVQPSNSEVIRRSATLFDSSQSLLALRYGCKKNAVNAHTSRMTLNSVCTSCHHGRFWGCSSDVRPSVVGFQQPPAPHFHNCPAVCVRPSGIFTAILDLGYQPHSWPGSKISYDITICNDVRYRDT